MCSEDHTVSALDTRCWENSNLEVNRINLDEQELIYLIDHVFCSSLFTQVKQPLLGCKMILYYIKNLKEETRQIELREKRKLCRKKMNVLLCKSHLRYLL